MVWNDPTPPPKHGVWERWTYGKDITGYTLRCSPMFFADVRRIGDFGDWFATLNSDPMGHGPEPLPLMQRIDEEVVRRVREMTGPYKLILGRVKKG